MNAFRVGHRTAMVLGLLVALGVTGCTANSAPSSTVAATSQPTSPPASAPASPPSAPASAAPASSGGIQNLAVSTAVRSELLAAFTAAKGIPVSDVARSVPNSIYYAYDPATETYWAIADYEPSPTDSLTVRVGFQDGGSDGFFKKSGSAPWQVAFGGQPVFCSELRFFPQTVLAAWSLPAGPTPPC